MKLHVGIVTFTVALAFAVCGCKGRKTTESAESAPGGPPTLRPTVKFETTLGDFVVALDAENAPGDGHQFSGLRLRQVL